MKKCGFVECCCDQNSKNSSSRSREAILQLPGEKMPVIRISGNCHRLFPTTCICCIYSVLQRILDTWFQSQVRSLKTKQNVKWFQFMLQQHRHFGIWASDLIQGFVNQIGSRLFRADWSWPDPTLISTALNISI